MVSNLLGLRSDPGWESSPKGPVGSEAAFPSRHFSNLNTPSECSGQDCKFLLLNTILTTGGCFFQPLILDLGCDLPYNSFYPRFGDREEHLGFVTHGRQERPLISQFSGPTPVSGRREGKSLCGSCLLVGSGPSQVWDFWGANSHSGLWRVMDPLMAQAGEQRMHWGHFPPCLEP